MKRKNRDLMCENCQSREATHLLYYVRHNKDSGSLSLINPSMICDTCRPLFLDCGQLFTSRPHLISFASIALWDKRMMGLTSKKRYDFNALAQSWWKKRLHRIQYIWKDYDPKQASL